MLKLVSNALCPQRLQWRVYFTFKVVEREVEILSLRRDTKYTTYCTFENMSQSTCELQLVCAGHKFIKYALSFTVRALYAHLV